MANLGEGPSEPKFLHFHAILGNKTGQIGWHPLGAGAPSGKPRFATAEGTLFLRAYPSICQCNSLRSFCSKGKPTPKKSERESKINFAPIAP